MAKARWEAEAAVIPVLRDDGTVYFQDAAKTLGVRLCEWTLALLWLLVPAVTIAALI